MRGKQSIWLWTLTETVSSKETKRTCEGVADGYACHSYVIFVGIFLSAVIAVKPDYVFVGFLVVQHFRALDYGIFVDAVIDFVQFFLAVILVSSWK